MVYSAVTALLFAWTSMASTPAYDLRIRLAIDGKQVAAPHIVTRPGETATVTHKTAQGESFLEVVADDREINGSKGILMKFTVGYIDAKGQRTVLSKPVIVALENEPAQIAVGDQSQKDVVSLAVTATRTQL